MDSHLAPWVISPRKACKVVRCAEFVHGDTTAHGHSTMGADFPEHVQRIAFPGTAGAAHYSAFRFAGQLAERS